MISLTKARTAFLSVLGALCVAAGCRDNPLIGATPDPAPAAAGRIVGALRCQVRMASNETWCARLDPAGQLRARGGQIRGPSRVVVAAADSMYWMVQTANPRYAAADSVFSLDVALLNEMATTIGTNDGSTVLGFKLFLAENPYVLEFKPIPDGSDPLALTGFNLSDSANTVRVLNPDGRQALLAANQPYFTYTQAVTPGQVSAYRTWQFHVPNSVLSFMFTVQLFASTPGEAAVPAQAPDTLPSWLFAPENVAHDLPELSGSYAKNALSVLFMPGTTPDERAAAISIVRGRVVGGYPQETGEGLYYVTLPADSTTTTVLQSVDQLNLLPQVAGATVVFAEAAGDQLDWLTPDDGPGWSRTSWDLDSTQVGGLRWGLEAIRAPLAWGCETALGPPRWGSSITGSILSRSPTSRRT